MIIGISGAHRVGKSTLAKRYAEKHGVQFLETSASACFAELGLDPAKTYDFKTRLDVQELILERFETIYKGASVASGAITDRTPLDLIAYTVADAVGDVVPADQQARFARYVSKCFEVLNKYFAFVVIVAPGVQIVEAEGKGALNMAYIEHLHTLFRGLVVDDRMTAKSYHLPRRSTDLEERLTSVEWCVKQTNKVALEQFEAHIAGGGTVS